MNHRAPRLLLAALALAASAACGRVVGAECIEGFDLCGDICCPDGMCSPDGLCLATDGGPFTDGDVADADIEDGGPIRLDGARPDMGPPPCDIGSSPCGTECVNLDFDVDNCGGCGIECPSGELCSFGVCDPTCEPPLLECGGLCVDPNSDHENCGGCGNVCDSEICRPIGCTGTEASDVILIGHDFEESSVGAGTLIGNSSLLRLEDPVRIVIYEGTVDAANRARVVEAIDVIATDASRSYQLVSASAEFVPTRLLRADTFLVMPQHGSETTDEELRALGRRWSVALASFLARGGAIVVLDGGGDHSGTWQILAEANLLQVDGRVAVAEDSVLTNTVPTDAITNQVPLAYSAPRRTVAFTGVLEGEVVSAEVEATELPVAVHRFLAAPAP